MKRIQRRMFVLLDATGQIWDGRIAPTRAGIYLEYGSMSAAQRDGLRLKEITIYYSI